MASPPLPLYLLPLISKEEEEEDDKDWLEDYVDERERR